jgi:hypothetical protein
LGVGTLSREGFVTTGDGRIYEISGKGTRRVGSTTITRPEGSVDFDTRREDGHRISDSQSSAGGRGMSIRTEHGRRTVCERGHGDLNPGHNGNVDRKINDGWNECDNGDGRRRSIRRRSLRRVAYADNRQTARRREAARSHSQTAERASNATRGAFSDRDYTGLERDYSTQRGRGQRYRQRSGGFQQRREGYRRGGGIRGQS